MAKWEDLLQLYQLEKRESGNNSGVHGLSKLTEVAIKPKPVERQRVTTCLRVFCEETLTALKVHPSVTASEGTSLFMKKVVDMWKILNVHTMNKDIRHNDPLEAVVKSPDDPRLTYLLEMGEMFKNMGRKEGKKRVKALSTDTSKALHHTLNGLVELVRHLLATSHQFVMIGDHCGDPIEKGHGNVRLGTGSAVFITSRVVQEKLDILKTKLLLKFDVDVQNLNADVGHQCNKCGFLLDEAASEVFDNLESLEEGIPLETKMSLCHIAGYVTRDDEMDDETLFNATTFYYQKYGEYTSQLDRGGLNVPVDNAVQWVFFCNILFNNVKDRICRKSLINLLVLVSQMHTFNMTRKHALTLSNIFLNNYCKEMTPHSGKEGKLKVLKVSK